MNRMQCQVRLSRHKTTDAVVLAISTASAFPVSKTDCTAEHLAPQVMSPRQDFAVLKRLLKSAHGTVILRVTVALLLGPDPLQISRVSVQG